eukprot:747287-Hanusia_phi.AAC.1
MKWNRNTKSRHHLFLSCSLLHRRARLQLGRLDPHVQVGTEGALLEVGILFLPAHKHISLLPSGALRTFTLSTSANFLVCRVSMSW